MLTVQKLEWLQPFKNLNTKIDVKVLPATVKNLSGKVWTPSLAKFLYSKGVVTWMCCYSAAKREDIANTDLRVVLLLALLGKTTVRQFRVNSAKLLNSSLWTKCWFLVNAAQYKQEVALGKQCDSCLPKGCAWIEVFLRALLYHCHVQITLIPLNCTFLRRP